MEIQGFWTDRLVSGVNACETDIHEVVLNERLRVALGIISIILEAHINNKYASNKMAAQALKDALRRAQVALRTEGGTP